MSISLWPPWTVAHQTPLSMGFPKQEYWSGLPFPSPRDLPDSGIRPPVSCLEHPLLFLENFLLNPWDPLRVSPALGSLSWSPTGGASCLSMSSHCISVCPSPSSHRCIVRSYLSLSPGDCKLLKGLCLLPQHTPRTQHWLYTQQTSTCSKNAVLEDPAILCNVTGHSKGKTFLIQKASTCFWI